MKRDSQGENGAASYNLFTVSWISILSSPPPSSSSWNYGYDANDSFDTYSVS